MEESEDDAPFAAFAQPKTSGLEQVKARQAADKRSRKEMWLLLACCLFATVLGATLAVSISVGFDVTLLAITLSACYALLGAGVSWLVGAIAWARVAVQAQAPGPFKPIGAEVVQGEAWDRLTFWLTIWALTGMMLGAGSGAIHGVFWVRPDVDLDGARLWGMLGAAIPLALVLLGWVIWKRRHSAHGTPGAGDNTPRS